MNASAPKPPFFYELLGLLHDLGKLSSHFQVSPGYEYHLPVNPLSVLPQPTGNDGASASLKGLRHTPSFAPYLDRRDLTELLQAVSFTDLDGCAYNLAEALLMTRRNVDKRDWCQAFNSRPLTPSQVAWIVHGVMHYEKEALAPQNKEENSKDLYQSSPFGFEHKLDLGAAGQPGSALACTPLERLPELWDEALRPAWLEALRQQFQRGVGDTQRPINEVSLWDWSSTAAALTKAAYQYIGTHPLPENREEWPAHLQWRVLAVAFDHLAAYQRVEKISDLLGLKRALDDSFSKTRAYLEVTAGLGNQIFADETGCYFLLPGMDLPPQLEKTIASFFQPDLQPRLLLGECVRGSQLDLDSDAFDSHAIRHLLAGPRQEVLSTLTYPCESGKNLPDLAGAWCDQPDKEICTVCGLRPCLSSQEHICHICRERRRGRAIAWSASSPSQTIWIDEVADQHGKAALLVGEFELGGWLDGSLVQTLRLKKDEPKHPSPARLHRFWQTTYQFWQEVQQELIPAQAGWRAQRLSLEISPTSRDWLRGHLEPNNTCEIDLNGARLGLYWDGNRLISIENLESFLERSGIKDEAALRQQLKGERRLFRPSEYGVSSQLIGEVTIARINSAGGYRPVIQILHEPEKFLALVPASCALELAQDISQKYLVEMGKVRDRLPLHLGLVFFPRRTPLRAVLEAGQRMFRLDSAWQKWQVTNAENTSTVQKLRFENGIAWNIPLTMGDALTPDNWYPYLLKQEPKAEVDLTAASRHATQITTGSPIWLRPSYFDFEELDTAGRRFEIVYGKGNRRSARPTRPYFLEEINELARLWQVLNGLERSQVYDVASAVEEARQRWEASPGDAVFRQFTADTLAEAHWENPSWRDLGDERRSLLVESAVSGRLADVVELYAHILKL